MVVIFRRYAAKQSSPSDKASQNKPEASTDVSVSNNNNTINPQLSVSSEATCTATSSAAIPIEDLTSATVTSDNNASTTSSALPEVFDLDDLDDSDAIDPLLSPRYSRTTSDSTTATLTLMPVDDETPVEIASALLASNNGFAQLDGEIIGLSDDDLL